MPKKTGVMKEVVVPLRQLEVPVKQVLLLHQPVAWLRTRPPHPRRRAADCLWP